MTPFLSDEGSDSSVTPVEQQLNSQEFELGLLHEVIQTITVRLTHALRPDTSVKPSEDTQGLAAAQSDIVSKLKNLTQSIQVATTRLNSLINRLEI